MLQELVQLIASGKITYEEAMELVTATSNVESNTTPTSAPSKPKKHNPIQSVDSQIMGANVHIEYPPKPLTRKDGTPYLTGQGKSYWVKDAKFDLGTTKRASITIWDK